MSGIRLLVSDHHGVYVPQAFVEMYDNEQWGISQEDMDILVDGPDNESYWDTWDSVTGDASLKDINGNIWYLYQDGDLWAFCTELMDDLEYENFFGEKRTYAA